MSRSSRPGGPFDVAPAHYGVGLCGVLEGGEGDSELDGAAAVLPSVLPSAFPSAPVAGVDGFR